MDEEGVVCEARGGPAYGMLTSSCVQSPKSPACCGCSPCAKTAFLRTECIFYQVGAQNRPFCAPIPLRYIPASAVALRRDGTTCLIFLQERGLWCTNRCQSHLTLSITVSSDAYDLISVFFRSCATSCVICGRPAGSRRFWL